jgi:hypothetical protein
MLDLSKLFKILPISSLEPEIIGRINGLTDKVQGRWQCPDMTLLEPPAGQRVPFVDPIETMTALFRHQNQAPDVAATLAAAEYAALRPNLRLVERVRFYAMCDPDPTECVPLPHLLEHLRARHLIAEHLTNFFDHVFNTIFTAPIFNNPDQLNQPWSPKTLPELPTAKAMIEFIPGHPWRCDMDISEGLASSAEWHRILRPIAERLELILGKSLYQFRDFDVECNDDYGHRFLILYCCCHDQPESPYVQFLREASGAQDIDSLKEALIDPENYRHPFEMNNTSCDDYVACACRFYY